MLMSTLSTRYAHALLKARTAGTLMTPITDETDLSMADAYDIARTILDARIAQGEVPVGRKIGFSNRKMWPMYGKSEPMTGPIWSTLFDSTVEFAHDNNPIHKLTKAQQPRIEPELVFKLARTPEPDIDLEGLGECLEWIAHGFEIVVSPFRHWEFEPADAVAAFGLHRALIIGEPKMLSRESKRRLHTVLSGASISLSRSNAEGSELCAAGFASDVMDSPLHALLALHQELQQQNQFSPLQAGELITTGSWTDALPIKRGEVWSSAFSQLNLPGLNLSLI